MYIFMQHWTEVCKHIMYVWQDILLQCPYATFLASRDVMAILFAVMHQLFFTPTSSLKRPIRTCTSSHISIAARRGDMIWHARHGRAQKNYAKLQMQQLHVIYQNNPDWSLNVDDYF